MIKDEEQKIDGSIFERLINYGLTPNGFYLLYCIDSKSDPDLINIHQELRLLNKTGFLDDKYKLTDTGKKALSIIEKGLAGKNTVIEKKASKKKTADTKIDKLYVDAYINIFPNIRLPSNKLARSHEKVITENFKWFLNEYNFSWDTILKATELYVSEYAKVIHDKFCNKQIAL